MAWPSLNAIRVQYNETLQASALRLGRGVSSNIPLKGPFTLILCMNNILWYIIGACVKENAFLVYILYIYRYSQICKILKIKMVHSSQFEFPWQHTIFKINRYRNKEKKSSYTVYKLIWRKNFFISGYPC